MERDSMSVPPTLNPEQHKLWSSEPDAAQRAVDAVVAELGACPPDEALLPIATHGTLEAAASFDPTRGVPYGQWAVYFAAYRVWEHLRRTHDEDKTLLAHIRLAMLRFMAHHHRFFDVWKDTIESDRRALSSFTDGLLFTAALSMGGLVGISRGVEDVVEAESARRTGEAVRKVVGELRPEQVYLLQQCAAYGEPVTQAARQLKKGYRSVLEDYHEVIALCGARLGMLLGSNEVPPWHPELSGQVFEEPPAPANDGGRG